MTEQLFRLSDVMKEAGSPPCRTRSQQSFAKDMSVKIAGMVGETILVSADEKARLLKPVTELEKLKDSIKDVNGSIAAAHKSVESLRGKNLSLTNQVGMLEKRSTTFSSEISKIIQRLDFLEKRGPA